MTKPILTLVLFILYSGANARTCIPAVEKSQPPRLVDGQWIQAAKPSSADNIKNDFEQIKKKKYDFIFSGIYTKEASFNNKILSHIKTKKIWQGNVVAIVDVDMAKLPTDKQCSQLKYDQEYIFFATLGNRNNPIQLKEFRTATAELKSLLGKPSKQWLRGRLIQSRD